MCGLGLGVQIVFGQPLLDLFNLKFGRLKGAQFGLGWTWD